jgi:4-hydroxyphenylpyruvate dioxygenase
MANRERVLYHGTVRNLPLQEQFRAAALGGYGSLTTGPREYVGLLQSGITTRDMKKMAADAGVRYEHLDPFARWLPRWQAEGPDSARISRAFGYDADDFFRFADALEAKSFTVVGTFPNGSVPLDELIDCFGKLCERAARHGLRCDLEFVPFWGIVDLESAWRIVKAVDAPNSGILFDFWHYSRGRPDDALLRTIPGHRITGVQINDGPATVRPGRTELEEARNCRVPPGHGEFRVRQIVGILREIGGLNNLGPEIFSADFDSLSAEDIVAKCRESIDWALAN